MSNFTVLVIIIALALISYVMGKNKVSGQGQNLHSLPRHYAIFSVFCAIAPALGVFVLWLMIAPLIVTAPIYVQITDDMLSEGVSASLFMADVQRLANGLSDGAQAGLIDLALLGANPNLSELGKTLASAGLIFSADINANVFALSQAYLERYQTAYTAVLIIAMVASALGMFFGLRQISPEFRARNHVERVIRWILMLATGLVIVTTIGIVFSMLFETINFMTLHSWRDFFFGLNWAPNFHGDSELAILPLLWGTLYISLIALFVAVPIGLYAAIYLSEYASPSIRPIAKPLLEVLAGIPTIVYGFFALIVFGPFLRDWFGDGGFLGVNWMADARSAATAGVVMGFMLIPFVSSLSDDIINAVPQALRDGSYGLGATQSETIKQVVFPAALPGIVGAILLAASRAIGETMIVVLGAGAIARFTANPFEALTTITTRIVSQLTGDGDFNSPETLVAFALGLSLFVITLGLNVLALAIVRKYREQYE
jgi:phosphate transport system permease protein